MTALAMNYVVNPFVKFFDTLSFAFEMAGMMRAARELYRLGYIKEYEQTLDTIRKMQAER